jgi:hypothetical protein
MSTDNKTTAELIAEINTMNEDLGDPELMAMTPDGIMGALQHMQMQARFQAAHTELLESDPEYKTLYEEGDALNDQIQDQIQPMLDRMDEIGGLLREKVMAHLAN